MLPHRVQLSRKKGFKLPPGTVVVSRPSRWGNPFRVGIEAADIDEAVRMYRQYINSNAALRKSAVTLLEGKNLACWCKPGQPCHADVLLEIANSDSGTVF